MSSTSAHSKHERSHWRTWAITAGSLLVVAMFLMGIAASPLFDAKTIEVTGMQSRSESQILEAAGVSSSTNVVVGFSASRIEDELETDPWIASADVSRLFPSTIKIHVSERTASAQAKLGGEVAVIASDGTTLELLSRDARLPQIRGVRPGAVGEVSEQLGPAAMAAASFDALLLSQRPVITIEEDGSLTVDLHKGIAVTYGAAEDFDAKAAAISGILRWASQNPGKVSAIDVRVATAPAATVERPGEPPVEEVLSEGLKPNADPGASQKQTKEAREDSVTESNNGATPDA